MEGRSRLGDEAGQVAGRARIGAPGGFGTGFRAPRLADATQRFLDLALQPVPVPRTFSLSQRKADFAIIVGRPEKGRLKACKLTDDPRSSTRRAVVSTAAASRRPGLISRGTGWSAVWRT